MKIVFFASVYPPDLGAGSFRAIALTEAIAPKINKHDQIHIITTRPYRYSSFKATADDLEVHENIIIHRIKVPSHKGGMILQAKIFLVYSWSALRISLKLKPDYIIATSSRLMTGVLAFTCAKILKIQYYIDLRDIFSETISDIFAKKNILLARMIKFFFIFLEKKVLKNAIGVNVVSQGFLNYFKEQKIDTKEWSFFPNGVDKEFLNIPPDSNYIDTHKKTILYAGNIGSGQGLEKIVPNAANFLSNDYEFNIIGDGGTISLLRKELKNKNVKNVNLIKPVDRIKLIEYYKKADILFLHLNDLPAFKRALPSKIFEYAAFKKPIVAGLSGYSEKFIKDNLDQVSIFKQTDYISLVESIKKLKNIDDNFDKVGSFLKKYSRAKIMNEMADQILYLYFETKK